MADLRRHNRTRIQWWLDGQYPDRFEGSPDPEMPYDGAKPTSRVLVKAKQLRNLENPDMVASDDWLLDAFFVRLPSHSRHRSHACYLTVLNPNAAGGVAYLEALEMVADEGSDAINKRMALVADELNFREAGKAKDRYKHREFRGVSSVRLKARREALKNANAARKAEAKDLADLARRGLETVLDWSVKDSIELRVGESDRYNSKHESSMAAWQQRTGKDPREIYATYRLYRDGDATGEPCSTQHAEHMAAVVHKCHTRTVKRAREKYDPDYGSGGGEAA